jgi:hypothetical protein
MASYGILKDIKPEDLQNTPPPELSQKEKRKNWWHYHSRIVVFGVLGLAVVTYFVVTSIMQVKPDLRLGLAAPSSMPQELMDKLSASLSPYVADLNGDGKQVVEIEQYNLVTASAQTPERVAADGTAATEVDPNTQMANMTRMTVALQDGNPALYLIDPSQVEDYITDFGMPGSLEGAEGGTADENTLAFSEVAATESFDLNISLLSEEDGFFDASEFLADFRFGLMPLPSPEHDKVEERTEIWNEAKTFLTNLQNNTPVSVMAESVSANANANASASAK